MTETQHPPAQEDSEPSRGERTRAQIITAAACLFVEQGYHGTSMRQIAEQAGIALGGIYNHFSGKEDIFQAALLEYHPIHRVLPALEAAEGETVEELVHQAADQIALSLQERREYLNLIFIEAVEFRAGHFPAMFSNFFPRTLAFATRITGKRGQLRPIPLPVMVLAFLGLALSSILVRPFLDPQEKLGSPQKILHQVVDIFLHGIMAEEAKG